MRIDRLSATPVRIPLNTPVAFSTRTLTHREYVVVRMECAEGILGVGYSYAGHTGARWLADCVENLIAPILVGRDSECIEDNWDLVNRTLLLLGQGGAVQRALAATDIAAWDLLGHRARLPLRNLLGGGRSRVDAYASGGYYRPGDPQENVREEIQRYQALGFSNFKIKVGGLTLAEDVVRVRAARETIGPNGKLALDSNNAWRYPHTALKAAEAFAEFDIWWLEEPLMPHDIEGHRSLTLRSPIPIATGEVLSSDSDFGHLLTAGACHILQPDAGVLGGITPWLRVARAAALLDRPIAPHWHANLHAQLAAATPNCITVEYFALREDICNFEAIVTNRLSVSDGQVQLDDRPGIGIELDEAELARFAISPESPVTV